MGTLICYVVIFRQVAKGWAAGIRGLFGKNGDWSSDSDSGGSRNHWVLTPTPGDGIVGGPKEDSNT